MSHDLVRAPTAWLLATGARPGGGLLDLHSEVVLPVTIDHAFA